MGLWKESKTMRRLDQMLENAMAGRPVEQSFDETKVSALETKLSHYLAANATTKTQLAEEKSSIHSLISDISHQTKTPLANILLYTQILSESPLAEQEKAALATLTQQTEKLNFLIASLVKASRLETGILTLHPQENSVHALFQGALEQAMSLAQSKGISLTATSTEACAVFDAKWTAEAVQNIVENAIKYTSCGGEVSLTAIAYQLFCRIDITDNGIGMSEEETAKIFARFYRSSAVSEQEGVGIGLYLAREIIASEGGYIKVKSNLQQGSTFSIFLPMKR